MFLSPFQTHILPRAVVGLALATSFGIVVHDTKIDHAASTALAAPMALINHELAGRSPRLSSEGHTHVERVSLANAVRDLHNSTPKIQPRDDHKRFYLPKNVSKGVHGFDGYYLPMRQV